MWPISPARSQQHVLLQGAGLSPKQISLCDDFVYIAQYGAGTASLNVSTAAAIVLHHFALWAAYPEQGRDGQKFVVAEKDPKAHATGMAAPTLSSDILQLLWRRLTDCICLESLKACLLLSFELFGLSYWLSCCGVFQYVGRFGREGE